MPSLPPQSSGSIRDLFEHESFLSILEYYVDLNCFILPHDPNQTWLAVHFHQRGEALYDMEKKSGFLRNWDKLADEKYERRNEGKPLLVENFGFYDIFMPIRRNRKRVGTLLSGSFADREVTYPRLREAFSKITGKDPSPENGEFRRFTRAVLATPVLESPALDAYREALELFARVLPHENLPGDSPRLRELTLVVFSRQFPHSYYMNWADRKSTR